MVYEKQTWVDNQTPVDAEHLNHIEDGVAALSEEMAGQTAPESFGAKGDGVTNDAAAIAQAFASGKNVVFDGTKTYAVGSTITIPADSFVDFRGTTVVPIGNHDVIRVMPGSHIENLIVRCTDVSGWDASAMVFYGGDMFRASNPTRINNVKLYNNEIYNAGYTHKGNGLYLYVDAPGQFVEGLDVSDLMTTGFGKGICMQGLDASAEFDENSNVAFIGANNFVRYWSFKDTYGIFMDHDHALNRITTNHFIALNIQSDYFGGTKYGIYCNGFENCFDGCLYDFFYMDRTNPIKAVYFGIRSAKNVLKVSAGVVNELGYLTDLGTYNRVVKLCWENELLVPNGYKDFAMIGNQDDILAFADKNMNCVLESLDGEPYAGQLSNVFNPTPFKFLAYRERTAGTSNKDARITINFKKAVAEITSFVLQFVRRSEPSTVRVTFYGDQEVRTVWETNDNKNHLITITPFMNNYSIGHEGPVSNVAKIVIELGGFANPEGFANGQKEWCLERILATGSDGTGNTWMRRDGGKVFGSIEYDVGCGPVLTGADGKKYMLTISSGGTLVPVEYIEPEEESPEVALLIPTLASGAGWYNTELAGAAQNTITGVTFTTNYETTGAEDASWFCDKDGVGHIMAFRNGTEVVIVPTTGSENIRLNEDSAYMFANDGTNTNFAALASISGTEMLVANRNTDMKYACAKNANIIEPICIPDGVTYMDYAFNECTAMTSAPELPEGMLSIRGAFLKCSALQNLPDVPSTVTNLNYAFQGCSAAVNVPAVIPVNVHSMENAFRGCFNLNGTIEVNTTKLSNYTGCFYAACAHSGALVLTGSCPLLAELAATNADGKVTVAS